MDDLQEQLKALKQMQGAMARIEPDGKTERNLPPGTVPFEFNGMKYYVLPLDEGDAKRSKVELLQSEPQK